ncbi:GerAB/ArcD/ProY family transporter, partial [Bacillus cereus]|nr:GerAB/ArcD/ProY family transporter [Bacillus cereus]
VFHLLKGIQFSFLERLEIIYIAYYLIVFSTTIYPYLFFSLQSIKNLTYKINSKLLPVSSVLLIIIFFIIFNPGVSELKSIYFCMDILNFIFFVLLPIFFYFYSILFTWFHRRKEL